MSNPEAGKEIIKKELPLIPKLPGVYRMLNSKNEILYVGKAKNLPNRLKSYVSEKNHIIRTERMLSQTKKLEITTTTNESEALLLEANLIKKHKPKFNILLKDDKSFPYIFISDHEFPRIERHRGAKNKTGKYYGPFASSLAVNSAIKTLQRIFLLRSCTDKQVEAGDKTCFNYFLKRCAGPCGGKIDKSDYAKLVEAADEFLSKGRSRKIQQTLSSQMEIASEELDFEKAAIIRDKIKSLNIIQSSLTISDVNLTEADVIAGYKESGKTCIQVFFYRSKQNWGNQAFFPKHDPDEKLSNILNSFVSQFYENKAVPRSIILSEEIKEKKLIEKTLSKKENKQINISIAKKGSKLKVINLATKNAKNSLNRNLYESQNNRELLDEISKKFKIDNNISLIEVYDNSHIQGTNSVGALITYGEEGFIKKRYRKFNIKNENYKQDDYGMIREVLDRRFKRAIQEKGNYLTFPDLVLIDGGKGQYSSARETLNELGLNEIPVIAIAKGKFRNSGNETFFHNGKEFKFAKNDPTLFFLQRVRDEAHRFAISAHRAKRKKGISKSMLDQINGIGSIRKRALLNHFGSARAVESASLDEIKSVDGVEEKVAKKIYNFFHEIINYAKKNTKYFNSWKNFNCSLFCFGILFTGILRRSYSSNFIYYCFIY
tara:strand:+ start:262 stop:2241 length:1980 start_codon:yes stop_codon:yes gene_type:complete